MTNSSQNAAHIQAEILTWCASVLGPTEIVADGTQDHPDRTAATWRLRTSSGFCYVKTFSDPARWESEVWAYEQWAPAFEGFAPELIAIRDTPPAILITELPNRGNLDNVQLPVAQERALWRTAGEALMRLHQLGTGPCFGPGRRDGTCAIPLITDAVTHVASELHRWLSRGVHAGYLSEDEVATVRAAQELLPAFEREPSVPCHRDYGPANWLVTAQDTWAGVIDFEFARWDVRVADFTRYPNWEWIERPDLIEAFFDGYGRRFTSHEEAQRLIGHVQYALAAVVWGIGNAYYGFAEEGRHALRHLQSRL
jgi:aminoglycoside/choline kinase family phosphotransferase